MSFDPFQRECLAAMGYAVYALAGGDGAAAGTRVPDRKSTRLNSSH